MRDSAMTAGELAEQMVQTQLRRRGIEDRRVLAAMRVVPRHHFIPDVQLDQAYDDCALPIAEGQTISQPYMVARMTELLGLDRTMGMLEVGTGSGYQTAILAVLAGRVVTIERHRALAQRACQRLRDMELPTGVALAPIEIVIGDGTLGHPRGQPYDRILITAAAPAPPPALCEQLADAGRIVLPLGDRERQRLTVIERQGKRISHTGHGACRFVPLLGEQGWGE